MLNKLKSIPFLERQVFQIRTIHKQLFYWVQHKIKKVMKKYMVVLPLSAMTLFVGLPLGANAQVAILEVIKAGVKKVIKAADLKVQRLQNKTIWLQNAQKVLENQLSKLKLTEIADWTGKQKSLYEGYYKELWEVKSLIAYYKKVKELTSKQVAIVEQYQWAWSLFTKDSHFSSAELSEMEKVYKGVLEQSLKTLDLVLVVVNSFQTQMTDSQRLELINKAAAEMDRNYAALKSFNNQNISLSIQRAKSLEQTAKVKELYGID